MLISTNTTKLYRGVARRSSTFLATGLGRFISVGHGDFSVVEFDAIQHLCSGRPRLARKAPIWRFPPAGTLRGAIQEPVYASRYRFRNFRRAETLLSFPARAF